MSTFRVVLADSVPTYTDEDGNEHVRPGIHVLRETTGGVCLHVTGRTPVEGTEIGEANDGPSFRALPSEHRDKILHASVYRRTDGKSLRKQIADSLSVSIGSRVPQSGKASQDPDDPEAAERALERARALAGDPNEPVERRRMAMDEVESGDVVDTDMLPPHQWLE